MDFGAVGLDGLVVVGSELCNNGGSGFASLGSSSGSSDPETKQKWYGSGLFLKQERSGATEDYDDWRCSKLSKTDHGQQQQQQQQQQQMLSFSCPKSDASSSKNAATLPHFHLSSSSSPYNRLTGYNSGIFNSGNMHGVMTETRGQFTPSQWIELEHQALIYKYITANVPIPSSLLIPIRKAIESAGYSSFSGGFLRPNTLGWGTFHLGLSSNTDPEPGRCRRTDGKKWRCSRDAVADQKYCERHMNRGRHRSRKPVEGQSGQSAATSTTTTTKAVSTISSSTSASLMGPRAGGLAVAQQQQQFKNLQAASSSNLSAATSLSGMFLNRENMGERTQDTPALSMLSSNLELRSKDSPFLISKQHNLYEGSLQTEFGLVTSDSLLNPSQKSSSLMSCRNFGSSQELNDQKTVSQHSLHQFMDDWPKSQSDRTAVSWPDLDARSDGTQLSISIPMAPTDFMSSTSSPSNEKTTLSPLRPSREFDPIQMELGVGRILNNEPNQRQANWIPISWETSMGGPLGEVLHNTNNSAAEGKNASALNLMTEGWDSSPRLASSPTGVLQKTVFGSLSNSSAGSSPRAENNKTSEGASLCNNLLGSTLVHASSLPAS